MISICIATRNRPELFKGFCQSILKTASHPEEVEFVIYRHVKDDSPYEYVGNHKEVWGELDGFDPGVNECQKVATGPIFGWFPDDLIFITEGWDELVKKAFDEYPDKIVFVHPRDNLMGESFGAVGFLHKNWIEAVGHFLAPGLVRRGDCWVTQVARNIKRMHYLREMVVKNYDIRDDVTHEIYMKAVQDNDNLSKYRAMKSLRGRDSEILRELINKK